MSAYTPTRTTLTPMMCQRCKKEEEANDMFAAWTCGKCAALTKLKERDREGNSLELTCVFVGKDRALVPVCHIWNVSRVMTLFMVGQFNVFQMVTEPNFLSSLSNIIWRLQKHSWWEYKIHEWLQANITVICARYLKTKGGMSHLLEIAMEIYMRGVSELLDAGVEYVLSVLNMEQEAGLSERLLSYYQTQYKVTAATNKRAWKDAIEAGRHWPDLDYSTSKKVKDPPLPIMQEIMKANARKSAMENQPKGKKRRMK